MKLYLMGVLIFLLCWNLLLTCGVQSSTRQSDVQTPLSLGVEGKLLSCTFFKISEADPEEQQNSRKRSLTLTNHYDVILIECFVYHSPPCILLPFIRL